MRIFHHRLLVILECSILLIILSCNNSKTKEIGNNDSQIIETEEINSTQRIDELKPDEMMFLVEGAIDTWFFYNLDNYASYTPIIRKTDYDSIRNIHIHHIRYRSMNLDGGYETVEKTFSVTFTFNDKGVPDFTVTEIN